MQVSLLRYPVHDHGVNKDESRVKLQQSVSRTIDGDVDRFPRPTITVYATPHGGGGDITN